MGWIVTAHSDQGRKKGAEEICSDLYLHEFSSSPHRAIRQHDNWCLHEHFEMFTEIWRPIQQLRSDQGSKFVGARNELTNATKELDKDRIQTYLTTNHWEFVTNVSCFSHWGGVWERQIRTTRSILNTILNDYNWRLAMSALRTFLYEVIAIINSRPLTYHCLNDLNSLEALTQNNMLTKKNKRLLPPSGNFVTKKGTLKSDGNEFSFWLSSSGVDGKMSTSLTWVQDRNGSCRREI